MTSKRKRAGTASKDAALDAIQSSAHDEDAVNPVPSDMGDKDSADPPAKRTRTRRADVNGRYHDDTASRPSTSNGVAQMPVNGAAIGTGENGEAGSMRMEAPPKAGSVDPVGYKTNPPPEGRPVRVYADGVFDMFHLGHMRVLQQAKCAFPDTYLIVGVTGDEETHKRKGLTVMSAVERAESLRHCRWVDEVVEDCPWVITMPFLEEHQIDYVAHDDLPYGASEGDDIYKPIKERGMFLVTQRTEGVSTTGIITKIVRDYEKYVSRQLKRGTKRQELNISWLKKNELDLKRNVTELRDTIRQNWTTTGLELSKELKQFWQPSRPTSPTASVRNGTPGRTSGARSPLSFDMSRGRQGGQGSSQMDRNKHMDFAAGYAMGLIGGVKGWMEGGSRRRNLADSRAQSPSSDGDSSAASKSPIEEDTRGRQKEDAEGKVDLQIAAEMEV